MRAFAIVLTRSFRRSLCGALAAVLLLAQLSVAAYACPKASQMAATQAAATTAMPCAEVDADFANLCAQSCQHGQQNADTASTALPVPGPAIALYPLPRHVPDLMPGRCGTWEAVDPAASPPLSILHCRRRD